VIGDSPWTKKLVQEWHVNIVAGRATLTDRAARLYAYVHKQVPSAAEFCGRGRKWVSPSNKWLLYQAFDLKKSNHRLF
jgi:hypothetical protein